MWSMKSRSLKANHSNDRRDKGMVMVWFGLMLPVFLGMGALVVDVGALYAERRQLQNGADAAVLAIGVDCAFPTDPAGCTEENARGIAYEYLGLNAADGVNTAQVVCVRSPSFVDLEDCNGIDLTEIGVSSGANFAHVRADSNADIDFLFAPILDPDDDGRKVSASATLAWGTPGGAPVLPLMINSCYFDRDWLTSGFPEENLILFFEVQAVDSDNDGFDAGRVNSCSRPGFNYLNQTSELPENTNCRIFEIYLDPSGTVSVPDGSTGTYPACDDVFRNLFIHNNQIALPPEPVILPVFTDCVGGGSCTGGTTRWIIDGFVAVEICGFSWGNTAVYRQGNGNWTGSNIVNRCGVIPGTTQQLCDKHSVSGVVTDIPETAATRNIRICGRFVPLSVDELEIGAGSDYGTRIVKMVG